MFISILLGVPGAFQIMSIVFVMVLIGLIPTIFYIITLQKTLNRCAPENRAMPPENVWLLLIPVFSMVWQFIVVGNIAKSLAAEFRQREIQTEEIEPGKSIGLAYCILNVCSIIPILGILSALAGLVCWIMYWVKIDGYSAKLTFPHVPQG